MTDSPRPVFAETSPGTIRPKTTNCRCDSMEEEAESTSVRSAMPFILFAAVLQGWALYGLHPTPSAITRRAWLGGIARVNIAVALAPAFTST
jgi:hypothetical protein